MSKADRYADTVAASIQRLQDQVETQRLRAEAHKGEKDLMETRAVKAEREAQALRESLAGMLESYELIQRRLPGTDVARTVAGFFIGEINRAHALTADNGGQP
jgi:hypothetical protein